MSFLQKFKKAKDSLQPPEGVRVEYSSYGQGMPSYLAPNAMITNTQQSSSSQQSVGSSITNRQPQVAESSVGQSQQSYTTPKQQIQGKVIDIDNGNNDGDRNNEVQQQQQNQQTTKQMKGKPNFLKKQENQLGNSTNGQQQQIQPGESKTRTEITMNTNSFNSNSNGNSKLTTTSSSKQSTRFCPSDPLALLDENDLNFPELDFPKKIVNDIVAAGGIRIKQSNEQLQAFLEDTQSMIPCVVGSLLVNKLFSMEPNIVKYRSLFACEILMKTHLSYQRFFKNNQFLLQRTQQINNDSKYITLSNQLLAAINTPEITLSEEMETQLNFVGGIDLSKFSKKEQEGQETQYQKQQQISSSQQQQQSQGQIGTNLIDLMDDDNDGKDDMVVESKPKKNLFKNLQKKNQQQQTQSGSRTNGTDLIFDEDIVVQQHNVVQQQVAQQPQLLDLLQQQDEQNQRSQGNNSVSNGQQQQKTGLFGKFKKNNNTTQQSGNQSNTNTILTTTTTASNNITDLLENSSSSPIKPSQPFNLLDTIISPQQPVYSSGSQYLNNTNQSQYQQQLNRNGNNNSTNPTFNLIQPQQQINNMQYYNNLNQQQQSFPPYVQYPQYPYGYQGYTGGPGVYPQQMIQQQQMGYPYQQPQQQQQQYSTINMDFTSQHFQQPQQQQSSVGALIDSNNFSISREEPISNAASKKAPINEHAFDFISL